MSDKLSPTAAGPTGNPAGAQPGNPTGTSSAAKTPENPAKVAFASFLGTAIEWYDYFLFGTAAVLVLNDQFFPSLSPVASQMSAAATRRPVARVRMRRRAMRRSSSVTGVFC